MRIICENIYLNREDLFVFIILNIIKIDNCLFVNGFINVY